ncbi:SIS domain-containing protein [Candidatus Pelagibacter bacterium nBUS_32]|jgi:D-sedoheptulose 7-phosphate isomerase|uniref:SIS domain-containing protein n=1 Tax=Candidatus Pelagibacter bacterium nBUS_32 TaxID=3374192 RepID=UPI003EB70C36
MKKKQNSKEKLSSFYKKYLQTLVSVASKIDIKNLDKAVNLIFNTIKKNNYIYVCGNGGSAAIANHYICDFFKQLSKNTDLKARIRSLNSDNYLISAISNDISHDQVFKIQAERYIEKKDILILISSSGNSKNIKEVLKLCKIKKIKTIGFSNFTGGYLKKNCNISIHSNINNYGIGEDINHILMHMMMQYITTENLKSTSKKKIIL